MSAKEPETTTITRTDRSALGTTGENICAGCRSLTLRVEQLENRLATLTSDSVAAPHLGTTACYWICIGVHAFAVFAAMGTPLGVTFGGIAILSAFGTWSVCHVLATRGFTEKILRSCLSASIVTAAALVPLVLIIELDYEDFFPMLLLGLPACMLSGWIICKLFVWVRGWRIVPPGYQSEYPRLQIRNLLVVTLMVAGYLALIRLSVDELSDLVDDELLMMTVYAVIPTSLSTLFACFWARILLTSRTGKIARNLVLMLLVTPLVLGLFYLGLIASIQGFSSIDLESMLTIPVYAMLATILLGTSPVFSFVMLRSAGYRLLHPT